MAAPKDGSGLKSPESTSSICTLHCRKPPFLGSVSDSARADGTEIRGHKHKPESTKIKAARPPLLTLWRKNADKSNAVLVSATESSPLVFILDIPIKLTDASTVLRFCSV